MAFLKRFFAVLDLDSEDEAGCSSESVSSNKRPRVVADRASLVAGQLPDASAATVDLDAVSSDNGYAGPIYLNRLLPGVAEVTPDTEKELTLYDIFECRPSQDGSPLQEALIANFMVDLSWLCEECPSLLQVPILNIFQGDGGQGCASDVLERRRELGCTTLIHSPPLPLQWGTHHSKMALLFYNDCLRICIRTFNDIFHDFHHKSQGIYLQDFPLRNNFPHSSDSVLQEDACGKDFQSYLACYLQRCGGGFDARKLDRYDFSSAAVFLVGSVPGYHRGPDRTFWGHPRLAQLLRTHVTLPHSSGGRTEAAPQTSGGRAEAAPQNSIPDMAYAVGTLLCQFSSLGSMSQKWIDEFTTSLSASTASSAPMSPTSFSSRCPWTKPGLQLVMPTIAQVRDSYEGWTAGVSLHARRDQLKPWLLTLFRRWGSAAASQAERSAAAVRARGAMPHVKTFLRYHSRCGRDAAMSWMFIGSQNLSKAAWGELQKDGTQLCIRSYELGVLVVPNRLQLLQRDTTRPQGRFMKVRQSPTNREGHSPLLCPLDLGRQASVATSSASSYNDIAILCPTQLPPGPPPSVDEDGVWVKDLVDPAKYGLDRFGTHLGERQPVFYGSRASTT